MLDSTWIVGEKEDGRIKARLCVKGCQEEVDPRSDSPTAAKDSMKMFLTITANERFKMKSLDVTLTFLHGSPLERDVFVAPPEEKEKDGIIWKLKKSCYGLYNASRKWFLAVREQLMELGMTNLSGDDAFFYKIKKDQLDGICILHVDDFLISSSEEFHKEVSRKLKGRFIFGKVEI